MEYSVDQNLNIQKSWIRRIGRLCEQYFSFVKDLPENSKLESTLLSSLLHSQLCYLKEISSTEQEILPLEFFSHPGIEVLHFTGGQLPVTNKLKLNCLRNALSHPIEKTSAEQRYKTTGFTSFNIHNDAGQLIVGGFIFTHSPHYNRDGSIVDLKKNPFNLEGRLTMPNQKLYLNNTEISSAPYLELKLTCQTVKDLIINISNHFKIIQVREL